MCLFIMVAQFCATNRLKSVKRHINIYNAECGIITYSNDWNRIHRHTNILKDTQYSPSIVIKITHMGKFCDFLTNHGVTPIYAKERGYVCSSKSHIL